MAELASVYCSNVQVFEGEWDDEGVWFYQAFNDEIANWALQHQKVRARNDGTCSSRLEISRMHMNLSPAPPPTDGVKSATVERVNIAWGV